MKYKDLLEEAKKRLEEEKKEEAIKEIMRHLHRKEAICKSKTDLIDVLNKQLNNLLESEVGEAEITENP